MAAEASQAVVLEGALEFKRIYLAFMWKTRRLVLSATGFLSRFKGNGFSELCESFEISSETEISKVHGSTTEFIVAFEHPVKHKLYTHHARAKSAAECDLWFETLSETKRKKVAAARQISKKELEQHHSRDDCWIAINGTVYDVSKFLVHHPGGPEFLMQQAGRDGSDPYNSAGHSTNAIVDQIRSGLVTKIGPFHATGNAAAASSQLDAAQPQEEGQEPAGTRTLCKTYRPFRVVSNICDDAANPRPMYRLKLEVDTSDPLPIGWHVKIRASINDKVEMRSFTPIRFDGGICELFYRVYPEPEGVMSRHLQSLQEDDRLEIMGPVGDPNLKHQVIKSGLTAFSASRAHAFTDVVLLAGGTGVTPMFQIASAALNNPSNKSRFIILSFSKNEHDICMHEDLIELQRKHSASLTVTFFASQLSASAEEGVTSGSMRSFSSQQLLDCVGSFPAETTVFCMCGPRDWMAAARALLEQGGVPSRCIHAWL